MTGTCQLLRYCWRKTFAQLRVVTPTATYLMLFQIIILRKAISNISSIIFGLCLVILGLAIFLEGLEIGLMTIGEKVGTQLPQKRSLLTTMVVAFVLGIGVTFAEPSIEALQSLGRLIKPEKQPYLYLMLNPDYDKLLVMFVGFGVGIGCVIGVMRMALTGYRLKRLIYFSLVPCLIVSAYMTWVDTALEPIVDLSWDCGAITTGPVTVPLVLSLGIGVSSTKKSNTRLSGFGLVTFASLFPILCVQIFALILSTFLSSEDVISSIESNQGHLIDSFWYDETPWVELFNALQAVAPLVVFMLFILWVVLKEKLPRISFRERIARFLNDGSYRLTASQEFQSISYNHCSRSSFPVKSGLIMVFVGMLLFNYGLRFGLEEIGIQAGSTVPVLFSAVDGVNQTPFYNFLTGLSICVAFVFVLGFGATIAEPALSVLGLTVEELTNGAFTKRLLIGVVAIGVGTGISCSVIKIIYGIPLISFLLPLYSVALILTHFSSDDFVGIAWDSAGVTTGPITVPLILSLGVSLGGVLDATGFGILALASVGPIISVLTCGLIVSRSRNSSKNSFFKLSNLQHDQAEEVEPLAIKPVDNYGSTLDDSISTA